MKKYKACALLAAMLFALTAAVPASATEANGCAPIAENLELETYRGVSVGGNLKAVDPDGGELEFEITTEPRKGELVLGEGGSFVYTPFDGKKGRDYFGYKAKDADGNLSQEATVIIKIRKQKTEVSYSDMEGNPSEYAAVKLAENGIFTGEMLAGRYEFRPDAAVTRGQFLAMCIEVSGEDALGDLSGTGFADDSEIPTFMKGYVGAALRRGIISGYTGTGKGAVFGSEREISAAEAAVMLDRALKINNVSASTADGGATPVWAEQSAANLLACDLLPSGMSADSEPLTRAEAAQMLTAAMRVVENR